MPPVSAAWPLRHASVAGSGDGEVHLLEEERGIVAGHVVKQRSGARSMARRSAAVVIGHAQKGYRTALVHLQDGVGLPVTVDVAVRLVPHADAVGEYQAVEPGLEIGDRVVTEAEPAEIEHVGSVAAFYYIDAAPTEKQVVACAAVQRVVAV